jgi:hypothetical protein
VRATLAAFVTLLALLAVACSSGRDTLSLEIVGEWDSDEIIVGSAAGEVGGRPYLFLMTQPGQGAASLATLRVLSVEDTAVPVEVATLAAPLESLLGLGGFALSGNTAYVGLTGGQEAGLWVVDVSDPASPQEIALMDAEYALFAPEVSGDRLGIRTSITASFAFASVADPAHPGPLFEVLLDRSDGRGPQGRVSGSAFSGANFLILSVDGLTTLDVSSPSAPRQTGFYANTAWEEPERKAVEGAGTSVLSKTEEVTRERLLSDMVPAGSFMDIALSGDYAYIAASDLGLIVLDLSDVASPREVARLEVPDRLRRVAVSGDLVYLLGFSLPDDNTWRQMGSWTHPVHVVDVSDPASPKLVQTLSGISGLPPWQRLMTLGERVLFVNNRTVHVIDPYGGQ